MTQLNHLGQPVGKALPDWRPPPWPSGAPLAGQYCRLERLDPDRHGADLFAANTEDKTGAMWTYLPYGPFPDLESYSQWLKDQSPLSDPFYYTILEITRGRPLGLASYLRISPESGSIEVGHLAYSPSLQRTRIATEAMFIMMRHAFQLGYRRYEWKCDSLNAPSRAAAERLGFKFEGIFRQATVYKGRTRDTAWFSILDSEWPRLQHAFQQWLAPDNFDASGKQRRSLDVR